MQNDENGLLISRKSMVIKPFSTVMQMIKDREEGIIQSPAYLALSTSDRKLINNLLRSNNL